MPTNAYVVDAVRSPIARRNGALADVRADELAAQVLNGLVGRVELDPGDVEDVQMGCVTQVGERVWLVTFMRYDLGYFDDETCRLEPIDNPFQPRVLPMCSE